MVCAGILIVSDSQEMQSFLQESVESLGLTAEISHSLGSRRLSTMPEFFYCAILDTVEGALASPDCVSEFAAVCSALPVVVLTVGGDVPTAVQAIRHGAREVIQKPIRPSRFIECISRLVPENL